MCRQCPRRAAQRRPRACRPAAAGRPLRGAHPAPVAGLHAHRGAARGARRRRHHCHLLGRRPCAAAAAALPRPWPPGQAVGGPVVPRLLADGALTGRLPRLETAGPLVRGGGRLQRQRRQHGGCRRAGASRRGGRHRRPAAAARARARARPHLLRQRRPYRCRRHRAAQLPPLAAALRRRAGCARSQGPPRRRALRSDRRDAGGLRLSQRRHRAVDADALPARGLRRTRRPLPALHRAPGTGRVRCRRAGRAACHQCPAGARGRHRRAAGGEGRRPRVGSPLVAVATAAGDPVRRRPLPAAHRLHQPGEPAAEPGDAPPPRAGGAHGARRQPRTAAAPAADRERPAGATGRPAGGGRRGGRRAGARVPRAAGAPPPRGAGPRPARAGLRRPRHRGHRHRVRRRARRASVPPGRRRGPARGRPRWHRRSPRAPAHRPGGRRAQRHGGPPGVLRAAPSRPLAGRANRLRGSDRRAC